MEGHGLSKKDKGDAVVAFHFRREAIPIGLIAKSPAR